MNKILKRLSITSEPEEHVEKIIENEQNLLVKQFQDLNITIYGTYEEPLFKAKDIGDLLGIIKIRDSLKNLDEEDKILKGAGSNGGLQEQYFITENGLYELIFLSKKPIAKQFKKWIKTVIKELRLKGEYKLKQQIELKDKELKEKENLLKIQEQEIKLLKEKIYEEVEKNGYVYGIKCDGGVKIGKTKLKTDTRIKGLQTGNVNNIEKLFDFHSCNEDLLEKCIHYILNKYRNNSNREFFDCNEEYIKLLLTYLNTTFNTLKSTYQNITKEELFDIFINNLNKEFTEKYIINDIINTNIETKEDDPKSEDNYISKFLNDVSVRFQEHSETDFETVKQSYLNFMRLNFPGIKYKFSKENISWKDHGFKIISLKICKNCLKRAEPGCCDFYQNNNRTTKLIIQHLLLIS